MINLQPQPATQQDFQAFDAWILRALVWLLGVISRLGAPRRSHLLHRVIRLCERNTEAIIFELAEAHAPPPLRRFHRPRAALSGFRLKRIKGSRYFTHTRARLKAEAGFAARVRHLIAVLADPTPFVARAIKLLVAGLKRTRLVAVAPPAEPMRCALPAAPAYADSS